MITESENSHIFVFPVTVDREKIVVEANKALTTKPLVYADPDGWPCDPEDWHETFYHSKGSTQGVIIEKADKSHYRVVIPGFASKTDIDYAFLLLRAVKKLYPAVKITVKGKEADLSDRAALEIWDFNFNNMVQALEEGTQEVQGCASKYVIDPVGITERHENIGSTKDLTKVAFEEFIRLQEIYIDPNIKEFEEISIPVVDDDEEYDDIRILTWNKAGVLDIRWREFGLEREGKIKIVEADDLYREALRHPKFTPFTKWDYLVESLSKAEFDELWDQLDGEIIDAPKTYLLRWNPAISSFSIENYMVLCSDKYEVWDMDWSVWEWQEAKNGDRFYMLREGDGINPGIVFRGVFTSDPYPGPDWRRQGIPRHYVDLECFDGVVLPEQSPWLTPDELEKAIPDINWRKGHSGELLTPKQADELYQLWIKSQAH